MSELDKTIEELEAEVQAELEEAAQDAPTKGAAKGDSMEKVDGEVQDLGKAVESPETAKGPDGAKATKKASDAQTKGAKDAGGNDTPTAIKEPLAAGDQVDHDGEELEEGKMTKEMMKAEMQKKMESMKAQDLKAAYEAMCNGEGYGSMEKKDESVDESTLDDRLASVDVSEDVTALVEGEELTEEFKEKASTIFEAAVKSKLTQEIDRLEEQYQTKLDEEVQATKDELVEKVDSYLNYVVENWMKENQLAIQNGLRTEIAEAFMGKLKDLFTESYIEVPESKVDLVDELAETVEELEGKLNEATESAIETSKLLEGYQREAVIREAAKDLADTEVEKLKGLVEDVDFEDEATFANKVKTIKESYFKNKTVEAQDLEEEVEDSGEGITEEVSDLMSSYIHAIRKVKK